MTRYKNSSNRHENAADHHIEMPLLSSAQAAKELGVTPHQIAMLVAAGDIYALKVGGSFAIDPNSLRLYSQIRCGKGRPLSAKTAWAALWTLSGLPTPWLSPQQQRRLTDKLLHISAAQLVWQTRKRAALHAFTIEPAKFDELRAKIMLSGKSCKRPDIFGMPKNEREIEGYVGADDLDALRGDVGLREGIAGNALLHVSAVRIWDMADSIATLGHTEMPVAVTACDLAASLDPREAHAGRAALETLLGALSR